MAKDDYDEEPEDVLDDEEEEDDEEEIDLELDDDDIVIDDLEVDDDDEDLDEVDDEDLDVEDDGDADDTDDDEEEDEAEEDEGEESLDVLLAREQGDDESIVRLDDEPRDGLVSVTTPIGADEFTCRSCFLVKRRAQLADEKKLICFDCA